jgi:hypothetical protein
MKAHLNDSDIDQIRDHLGQSAKEVRPSNPLASILIVAISTTISICILPMITSTIIKAEVTLAPIFRGH